MVFEVTNKDLEWLKVNQPGLTFNHSTKTLNGVFSFSCQFADKEVITDSYQIEVKFDSPERLPLVFEMGGRIRKTAKMQEKPLEDLHQYEDNHLCLIRWDKMKDWYKNGFDFKAFIRHLETHFYWLSYVYRYNNEPWPNIEMQLKYE